MKTFKSIQLNSLGFIPQKKGDLLFQEVPILVHFISKDNPTEHYLYKWADCDETTNRWLIFKVTDKGLIDFFTQQKNLRDLLNQNAFVFLLI